MEFLTNMNDWFGPLMVAGAIFAGATILIGESLFHCRMQVLKARKGR